MKKIFGFAAVVLAASLMLAGCGGAKVDGSGWYNDFEAAKKTAQRQNKNILLFVNSVFDIEGTGDAVKMLLETPDFVNGVKDNYVCVHFDFTQIAGDSAVVKEGATGKEQKAAEAKQKAMNSQFQIADMYSIQTTPAAVLLTKDGYFVTQVNFDYASTSADGYINMVELEADAVNAMNDKVAATKKGSKMDRIKAIDALFESTESEAQQLLFADLYRKIPDMDKKDESGLVSKYLFATANADAYSYIKKLDIVEAVKTYEKAAENTRVNAEDRQALYYIAANVLASSGSNDYSSIIDFLQKSYDSDPESSYAGRLKEMIEYIKQMQNQEAAAAEEEAANAK